MKFLINALKSFSECTFEKKQSMSGVIVRN